MCTHHQPPPPPPHTHTHTHTHSRTLTHSLTHSLTHTHTQTCKHRQTGSSHCSSFVYTLTFSQHLSYVLYTFGKRGLFPTGDPIVPFVISPQFECLNKRTHTPTPTHTVHMALMGYFIVFSFVTKPGQTLEFLLWGTIVPLNFLAGYYCSIVASTPQPTVYASTMSCFTYTVWTFFCSRVLKKVKFFKPLPFPLKIVLGQISSQSFLLIFSSILRQITPNPNAYPVLIENI